MKYIFTVFFLLISSMAYAEPIVTHDVHVMNHSSPSQCPSSWNGGGSSETDISAGGRGQSNAFASTAVQSCVGCTFDSVSGDCVCKSCYAYTN